jgi:hypothetical protein
MIFVSTYNDWITFQVLANAPKVFEQLFLYILVNEWMAILGTEGYVQVFFDQGLWYR